MSPLLRIVLVAAGAATAGAAAAWAFLAYTRPDMVLDFAAWLQTCGIPLR